MIIKPGDERIYNPELYVCSFCGGTVFTGVVWVGPNLSICNKCAVSGLAADILGRILGDAIFAVGGTRSYAEEVERVTKQVEASIYRILYNHARLPR